MNVDVVRNAYSTTDGVAIQTTTDPAPIQIRGLVRTVNDTITPHETVTRTIRASTLTIEILEQSRDSATLRVTLIDATTGAPIVLERHSRSSPLDQNAQTGYITLADQHIRTNDSGVAIATLTVPGSYTARYHPGSWLDQTPAYTADTAPVRWHPLTTIQGWFSLITHLVWRLTPLLVVAYAGHRLLTMLTTHRYR